MTEKKTTRWAAGQSGNPRGKPAGSGQLQRLRETLADDVPEILAILATAAKAGDIQAARLILERVLPPVKAIEQPQPLSLPDGDLTAKGHAVLTAAANGELAPTQAAALIGALGTLARVAEVDDLTRRIEALETKK